VSERWWPLIAMAAGMLLASVGLWVGVVIYT
jgi:hypothetical protein